MILFFDVETTGLPDKWNASYKEVNNWPRIVEFSFSLIDEFENSLLLESYIIKPVGFEIPQESTLIHNISNRKAINEGVEIDYVLNRFESFVTQADLLVAHNIEFDINVILSEFYRHSIQNSIGRVSQLCLMKSTTNFCSLKNSNGISYKFPSLIELYHKLFRYSPEKSHSALDDVETLVKCFYELKRINVL